MGRQRLPVKGGICSTNRAGSAALRWLHSAAARPRLQVSRTKTRVGTKWKCQMKNGIMHLNGRDIIFHKGNGEMQF